MLSTTKPWREAQPASPTGGGRVTAAARVPASPAAVNATATDRPATLSTPPAGSRGPVSAHLLLKRRMLLPRRQQPAWSPPPAMASSVATENPISLAGGRHRFEATHVADEVEVDDDDGDEEVAAAEAEAIA